MWLLENNYFDEVIIWRLTDTQQPDIIFNINGKKYIQRWVKNFKETFDYPKPTISFFRGGFRQYDEITRIKPKHLGLKLYLGAGKRIVPQWNGVYDYILVEDERDFLSDRKCLPFFKTASPHIFKPTNQKTIEWDICWPCNFGQYRYKGQEFFIDLISKNKNLQKLKIIHFGNKPEMGKQLCDKYKIKNIYFAGPVDRPTLNNYLNKSKFGLNVSNLQDGCPRISTEILMSGTPLIIKDTVRLLNYFKTENVIDLNFMLSNINNCFFQNYPKYKQISLDVIENKLSFENISKKNIKLWLE